MRASETHLPVGMVVEARAGRDTGRWFLLIRPQTGTRVWMADGVTRSVETPKQKNVRHVRPIGVPDDADRVVDEIRTLRDRGRADAALRACLARYRVQREAAAGTGSDRTR